MFLQILVKAHQEIVKDFWYQWNQWNQHHNPEWQTGSKKERTVLPSPALIPGRTLCDTQQLGTAPTSEASYTQVEKANDLSQLNLGVAYAFLNLHAHTSSLQPPDHPYTSALKKQAVQRAASIPWRRREESDQILPNSAVNRPSRNAIFHRKPAKSPYTFQQVKPVKRICLTRILLLKACCKVSHQNKVTSLNCLSTLQYRPARHQTPHPWHRNGPWTACPLPTKGSLTSGDLFSAGKRTGRTPSLWI